MRRKRTAGMVLRHIGKQITTRWNTIAWYWQVLVVASLAIGVTNLALGNWLATIGGIVWGVVILDWQYLVKRCDLDGPFVTIGLGVTIEAGRVFADEAPREAGRLYTDDGREVVVLVGPADDDEEES